MDPSWLALRESADASARASDLVDEITSGLPSRRPLVIHDLACGTGAMLRWLAPRLPGPQHWVVHDLDAVLLAELVEAPRPIAADGSTVTVEPNCTDVSRLSRDDLADAALITGSAVLDLLTEAELHRLVRTCADVGCPVLLSLTVTGAVSLHPAHPLDSTVIAAFNGHQRRTVGDRVLAGPSAADLVTRLFAARGRDVVARTSSWRLDSAAPELTDTWLRNWLAAARDHAPQHAADIDGYAAQRLGEAAAGRLRVLVGHRDLLVR